MSESKENTVGLAPVSEVAAAVPYKDRTARQLTEAWADEGITDLKTRNEILAAILEKGRKAKTEAERNEAIPSAAIALRERQAGLYPDPADPFFAARLFEKREFYEARAVAAGVQEGTVDPCSSAAAEKVFELTPVQRIVSRFLHPLTPYMGMLLFHGVGVGKTCSAVTIAEQFLGVAPTTKVIVIVPQALKENFKRTVFDPTKLTWAPNESGEGGQWRTRQCTGTSYLERLDLLTNPDLRQVVYKTEEDRRNRYTVTGYQAFANWIERTLTKSIPSSVVDPEARRIAENEILRRLFSDHLIIIDEAHNLRDVGAETTAAAGAEAAAKGEEEENRGGKALNPFLKRIALNSEGLRLVLMTATPMYNSAQEILLLLNYLAMNDSKLESSALKQSDLFEKDGSIKSPAHQRLLERLARRYVSYMRGENPYTFPLRMKPLTAPADPASLYPAVSATKRPMELTAEDAAALNALPLIFSEPLPGSPVEIQLRGATARGTAVATATATEGVAATEAPETAVAVDTMLDYRMQMANICYPDSLFGGGGWDNNFVGQSVPGAGHKLRVFSPRSGFDVDSIFSSANLQTYAPKMHTLIESVKKARGICFAYSRYIKAGALPLAVALERAGYQRKLADGRIAPLLRDVAPVRPVCAICGLTNAEHGSNSSSASASATASSGADHPFQPACYILLTSDDDISPNFPGLVRYATNWDDPQFGPLGSQVKVIIGSQVASEGLDLKCIREMHILDSWYHLNRTDQIIGRAIRYCSHSALRAVEERQGLPLMSLNNCLIYMHVSRVPETEAGPALETADMYAYRIAIRKAQMVGKVQRLLKKHAWDCNLELEAITFAGLPPRKQIDAQGNDRRSLNNDGTEMNGYNINDQDYTTYCDYQVCKHECATAIVKADLSLDNSTFSVTDARRLIVGKQGLVRHLFDEQVMVPETIVQDIFGDLPWEIASEALMELLDGRRFRLTRPDGVEGFLVKKAGFLVFQPAAIADTDIPMAMRYARSFQLQRHFMTPVAPVWGRMRGEDGELPPSNSSASSALVASSSAASAATVSATASPANPELMSRFNEWIGYVTGGYNTRELPAYLPKTQRIWKWILERFAAVPETAAVAARWWFEKVLSYKEQRTFLEMALAIEDPADPIRVVTDRDVFRNPSLRAYRIYNPSTSSIDLFRRNSSGAIVQCAEGGDMYRPIIEKGLAMKPTEIPADTGALLGFLASKTDQVIFKTLDIDKVLKTDKKKYVGAECGGVSNMPEHRPRVQLLHAAARDSDLAALIIDDDDASWDESGAKKRMADFTIDHLKDITHQPLCLYMEVLARLLDAHHVGGKRWFLDGIEGVLSGIKGKK